jgi:hypothetical protein
MSMRNPILRTMAAVSLLVLVSASGAFGQQSADQQKCLNKLNKDGSGVAKQQGKENFACLKSAGSQPGSAQSCLTADVKGKVLKKKNKTVADDAAACGTSPDFGYTGAATVNASAVQGEVDLVADIFGGNLDAAVISCTSNKPGCQCQEKVLGNVEKLADTKFAEFVKCKKAALKAGATSVAALNSCVNNAGTPGSIAADTKGKIQKASDNLNATIVKSCDTPGVTGAFPGDCTGLSGGLLGTCLDVQVECRVCQMINEIDGMFVNCDLFDDGIANASCASGSGPTPTPTPTLTPTPTVTASPVPGFKGALGPPSTGLFNYAGVGIPGSDAACNTNFPGSHSCTYAELQTWDAANQLIGLLDTNSTPVTAFWAIDSAQPGIRQCDNPVPWGYQTAHTGHFGDKVPLTAGHLGALQPSQLCLNTSWVGCCV